MQLKIIDFGSACWCGGDDLTSWAGTLFYASPECSHHAYGRAADVWAVGVLLWVLLREGGPPPVSEMLQVPNPTPDTRPSSRALTGSSVNHGSLAPARLRCTGTH